MHVLIGNSIHFTSVITMSDIDSDYDQLQKNFFNFDRSPVGTPTASPLPASYQEDINQQPSSVNFRKHEQLHKRSRSDNVFSTGVHETGNPFKSRHRRKFKEGSGTNMDNEEMDSGNTSVSIPTEWDRSLNLNEINYYSDFAPFERNSTEEAPSNLTSSLPAKPRYLKQALIRTVKRVLPNKPVSKQLLFQIKYAF